MYIVAEMLSDIQASMILYTGAKMLSYMQASTISKENIARGTTDPDGATCISCKFGHQMAPLA